MARWMRGFTLAELLITLAVAAIMLILGVPAFTAARERIRVDTAFHVLTASLMAARTTAITRSEPVTVCPSADGLHCRDDQIWEDGWIIFADPRRTGEPAGADDVLRRIPGLGSGISLRSTQGRPRVRYLPSGRAFGSNLSLRLCFARSARLVGRVIVNNEGRARSERAGQAAICPFVANGDG